MSQKTRYLHANLGACMLPWTEDFQLDTGVFDQQVQEAIAGG